MLCIIYVITVSALLGVFGVLVEQSLPTTFPRRFLWCVIIPTSVFLPGYYRYHHSFSVTDALGGQAMTESMGQMSGSMSFGLFNPAWWAHTNSYNSLINQMWLVASALLILWGLVNAFRVWQIVRRSRLDLQNRGTPSVIDGVSVLVTDRIGPATVGLLRSSVLVPKWVLALPGIQRRYVLCHEEQHRQAHDSLLLFVASSFIVLMPWNVALWWNLRRLRLAVEMDCDNRVVAKLGNANAYGELLLKVAQAGSRGPRLQPALLGAGMLERRLTALLAPTQLKQLQKFLLPATAAILLLVVLWMPHPVTGSHKHSADIAVASSNPTLRR